jgi:hypothetical protein
MREGYLSPQLSTGHDPLTWLGYYGDDVEFLLNYGQVPAVVEVGVGEHYRGDGSWIR